MSTPSAAVAAHSNVQRGGSPPERRMSKHTSDRVARSAFLAAAPTPPILSNDPAGQHRPIRLHSLAGHLQPQLIKTAERAQIGPGETIFTGNFVHVEAFPIGRK